LLQQFGFQPDTAGAFLEMPAADQEGVFDPLAQRGNLGRMQAGAMSGQFSRDDEEQARAIGGDDGQHKQLPGLVGFETDQRLDADQRLNREVPDLP
jgi:hypothetical protein